MSSKNLKETIQEFEKNGWVTQETPQDGSVLLKKTNKIRLSDNMVKCSKVVNDVSAATIAKEALCNFLTGRVV